MHKTTSTLRTQNTTKLAFLDYNSYPFYQTFNTMLQAITNTFDAIHLIWMMVDGCDEIFSLFEQQKILIFGFILFVIILTLNFLFLCAFRAFFAKIARVLFIMDKHDSLIMMWQMMFGTIGVNITNQKCTQQVTRFVIHTRKRILSVCRSCPNVQSQIVHSQQLKVQLQSHHYELSLYLGFT
jgi:hypothetical protein